MNDDQPIIIETEEEKQKVRPDYFPVKRQLAILSLVLLALLGGYFGPKSEFFSQSNKALSQAVPETKIPSATPLALARDVVALPQVQVAAEAVVVYDVRAEKILYEKNPDTVLPLASITKLMTALLAYELTPDNEIVTISSEAEKQQSGGTLKAGEKYKAKKLADFALISSYNSAAYTLADAVGRTLGAEDPVGLFVAGMNVKATDLGLMSLEFINPTGLDLSTTEAGAYGSARDVTFLMKYLLQEYPEVLRPTVREAIRIYNEEGGYHDAENTNPLIKQIPNLLATKTGYTDLAGGNLTVAFDAGFNRPIIVTVLGSTRTERFDDVMRLIEAVQETMQIKE